MPPSQLIDVHGEPTAVVEDRMFVFDRAEQWVLLEALDALHATGKLIRVPEELWKRIAFGEDG